MSNDEAEPALGSVLAELTSHFEAAAEHSVKIDKIDYAAASRKIIIDGDEVTDEELRVDRPASFVDRPPKIERAEDGSVTIEKTRERLANDYDDQPVEGTFRTEVKFDRDGKLVSVRFCGTESDDELEYTPEELDKYLEHQSERQRICMSPHVYSQELRIVPVLLNKPEDKNGFSFYFEDQGLDDSTAQQLLNTGSRRFFPLELPRQIPTADLDTMVQTQQAPALFRQ